MIGVIERIKNNVLLKCSNLNDEVIGKKLVDALDKSVYQFAEELMSLLDNIVINITEDEIRISADECLKGPIIKKIKRKLFIDSLALQITNDSYIEDYVNKSITYEKLLKSYVKELEKNKKSNQLNMTEDLNLSEIIQKLSLYVQTDIISKVNENEFIVKAINTLVERTKDELESMLKNMIDELNSEYLNILTNELNEELEEKQEESVQIEDEGEEIMMDEIKIETNNELENDMSDISSKFSKYDDITLFNKMLLSLNTKEEKLTRSENKLAAKKAEIEELLANTNKKIEANIERENKLSQRKLELNSREKELNAKLSEAEVIFLNMKPLIKGLNSIKASEAKGGNYNE